MVKDPDLPVCRVCHVRVKTKHANDVKSFPLEWWKAQEKQFPLLGRLIHRYLCICATSVPSERVFSAGGEHCHNFSKPARGGRTCFSGHKSEIVSFFYMYM